MDDEQRRQKTNCAREHGRARRRAADRPAPDDRPPTTPTTDPDQHTTSSLLSLSSPDSPPAADNRQQRQRGSESPRGRERGGGGARRTACAPQLCTVHNSQGRALYETDARRSARSSSRAGGARCTGQWHGRTASSKEQTTAICKNIVQLVLLIMVEYTGPQWALLESEWEVHCSARHCCLVGPGRPPGAS